MVSGRVMAIEFCSSTQQSLSIYPESKLTIDFLVLRGSPPTLMCTVGELRLSWYKHVNRETSHGRSLYKPLSHMIGTWIGWNDRAWEFQLESWHSM